MELLKDLSSLVGDYISDTLEKEKGLAPVAKKRAALKKNVAISTVPKPVLQLNMVPEVLDASQYENAISSANPNGSYTSLYRFRDLANSIPFFTKYYQSGGMTVENVYNNLINGATVMGNAKFTQQAFYAAQQKYSNSKLAGMAGIPDTWLPVYAEPYNWPKMVENNTGLQQVSINLNNPVGAFHNEFSIIGRDQKKLPIMVKKEGEEVSKELKTASGDAVNEISFRFMEVKMVRNWFDLELFTMNQWYLSGQPIGYYSSGETTNNNGVFSLLPVSVIVGVGLKVAGNFRDSTKQQINKEQELKSTLGIGPFSFGKMKMTSNSTGGDEISSDDVYIIGYVSSVIPLSPKLQAS